MAQTIRTFAGDGVTTLYPVSFDLGYIRREFVYVYTGDDSAYETQVEYTWVNNSQIQLASPVDIGTTLKIRRVVPRNTKVNDYEDGARLAEGNLDGSFAQALMIWEELSDGFYSLDGDTTFNFDLDMNGNTITNVTVDEEDGTSVITLDFADGRYVNVAGDTMTSPLKGPTPVSADDYVPFGFADARYVNVAGDTMTSPLKGPNSSASDDYMPQLQVVETIDSRIASTPGFDPQQLIDYGLVTGVVGDELDYGSI